MKRSTLIYILLFVLIAVIAAVLYFKQRNTTLPVALQDFAVSDTASVTKVQLSDKKGRNILLERQGPGVWKVNGRYNAEKYVMDLLLETIKLVQVKNPIPLAARNSVISQMSTNAIKVEVYKGNELVKTYYVGGTTPDQLGTYMLIKGSSEPFVTQIPGFNGFLTPRFPMKEQDWRTTEIYALNPADITEVSIEYPKHPESSFKLTVKGDDYMISKADGSGQMKLQPLAAKRFLVGFKKIHFEVFSDLNPMQCDSVAASQPFAVLNVKTSDPKSNPPVLSLYYKKAGDKTKSIGEGNVDLDKYFAIIGTNKHEVVIVQDLVFSRILPSYKDLTGVL